MATSVRIVAEHAGDKNKPKDTRRKIVFDAILLENHLKQQRCFGVAFDIVEGSIQTWPFLLDPPESGRSSKLNFGSLTDPQFEAINIFEKKVEIGELFTRKTADDIFTYRIAKV